MARNPFYLFGDSWDKPVHQKLPPILNHLEQKLKFETLMVSRYLLVVVVYLGVLTMTELNRCPKQPSERPLRQVL